MARILIVAGGCRGRRLATSLVGEGHAVRITTRDHRARASIEEAGAECWIGTPDRLATLRAALDGVTILCWLLASARGTPEELAALHGTRLEFFLTQAIDTTVRGFLYEAPDAVDAAGALGAAGAADGEPRVRALLARNAIPGAFLRADPEDVSAWLAEAGAAVAALLTPSRSTHGQSSPPADQASRRTDR